MVPQALYGLRRTFDEVFRLWPIGRTQCQERCGCTSRGSPVQDSGLTVIRYLNFQDKDNRVRIAVEKGEAEAGG